MVRLYGIQRVSWFDVRDVMARCQISTSTSAHAPTHRDLDDAADCEAADRSTD